MHHIRVLAASLCALLIALSPSALAQDWELSYEKDGVEVYKKEMPGTPLVAFKGKTVYDVDIHLVMGVLMDNEHRIEWVDRLYTNYILEQNTPFDYVLYQAFELPALFADRDYVYHGVATRNEDGTVELKMNSVEHPEAPETVGVRAELVNSRYVLTPLPDGRTQIEVEILTDPKGWMPAWLVNLVQKDWPYETLKGIEGQFAKPHVKPHDLPGEAEERAAAEAAEKAAEAAEAEGDEAAEAEGDDAAEVEGDDAADEDHDDEAEDDKEEAEGNDGDD